MENNTTTTNSSERSLPEKKSERVFKISLACALLIHLAIISAAYMMPPQYPWESSYKYSDYVVGILDGWEAAPILDENHAFGTGATFPMADMPSPFTDIEDQIQLVGEAMLTNNMDYCGGFVFENTETPSIQINRAIKEGPTTDLPRLALSCH